MIRNADYEDEKENYKNKRREAKKSVDKKPELGGMEEANKMNEER
jgi:hypothetical protein